MTFSRFAVLALALAAGTSQALANESNAFKADDIRSDIIGKRIYLAAPLGGEFPLNYRRNGVVDGSGEAVGLGRFAKPNDSGKWWIDGDRLCQRFSSWYKGEPMCFDLYKTGDNKLKWVRNNGQTGTARIGQSL